ncbi:MAG: hypothetical protein ACD_3C00165G0005 [uncultured bacterium (gcode 4)]|uniref:Uncharacterized protein n=1 Tax=uncultured bacterium (gcode 4) TaxID=1234023 RepID=K2F9E6_9BACT|nr:MAG: hypothetical protein ACD_3C00165G0005 [uncultured bacterium (gcode 4)]
MKSQAKDSAEYIPSENICQTSLEALKSEPAKRVLVLALKKYWLDSVGIEKFNRIYWDVMNSRNVSDEDIAYLQEITSNKEFIKCYNSVIKKITFKDVSIEDIEDLLKSIEIWKLLTTITKLIVKARLKHTLTSEKNLGGAEKIDKKFEGCDFVETDGEIYEKIWNDIFKTTLDENVKILIKKTKPSQDLKEKKVSYEEVVWINNPEAISKAETDIKWLWNVIALYKWTWYFAMLSALYRSDTGKTLNIEWSWAKLSQDWEQIKFDRKWRLFVEEFHNLMLIDLNNLEIVAYNTRNSFDYNWNEYFIHFDTFLPSEPKAKIYSKVTWFSITLDWVKKISELEIDEENGVITYGWTLGFKKKKVQLS